MASILQISGKDLGALALKGFCPRCFWISRRTKLPWQIFPGIFSSIDSYSKKVVHGLFDQSGMPGWLAPLGELKGYKDPPSAQNQDRLFPIYRVQLNAYAYIARKLGWNPVSALALIYTEPVTTDEAAVEDAAGREDGFALGFAAKIVPVALEEAMLAPLFARAAENHALEAPPAAREGCGDCVYLEKIRGLLG